MVERQRQVGVIRHRQRVCHRLVTERALFQRRRCVLIAGFDERSNVGFAIGIAHGHGNGKDPANVLCQRRSPGDLQTRWVSAVTLFVDIGELAPACVHHLALAIFDAEP